MEKNLDSQNKSSKIDFEIALRTSTPLDSDLLCQFFKNIPILGEIDLSISRDVDFFSLYNRFQLPYLNLVLTQKENNSEQLLGTATFLFQQLFASHQSLNVAFACDLRISPNRQAIINWSRYFLPQINAIKNEKQINHFITTINLDNTQVINAFIKTKQKKSNKPQYELLRRFNFVSIHGYYPLFKAANPHIVMRYATPEDKSKLIKYITQHLVKLDLVPTQYLFNLEETIDKSLLYSFKSFILALDNNNQIIGCCHPVSSTLLQNYFPLKYDSQSNNFRQFLKLASLLKFGRTLTRPFSRTQKDMTLQFQFLHFLFFDHSDIFKALTFFAYKKSKNNEFLVYTYEDNQFQYRPPKGTISTSKTYGFYEIKSPNDSENSTQVGLMHKLKNNLWLDGFIF